MLEIGGLTEIAFLIGAFSVAGLGMLGANIFLPTSNVLLPTQVSCDCKPFCHPKRDSL
jgi:hypothetical protein